MSKPKGKRELEESIEQSKTIAAIGFVLGVLFTSIAVGYILGAGAAFGFLALMSMFTYWRGKQLVKEETEKVKALDEPKATEGQG